MKRSILTLAGTLAAFLPSLAAAERFVVHEWGVQILGRASGHPIMAAPEELVAGLPKFVGRNQMLSPTRFEFHGWDKPIIHLYGEEGLEISVKVATPLGVPLAYFPRPEIQKDELWAMSRKLMMAGKLHFTSGLEWRGKLRAAAPDNMPEAPADHWWNAARAIPSKYIHTNTGSDRFLFYEATAVQQPVVSATITDSAIELANRHDEPVGPVVIVINDGANLRGARLDSVDPAKGAAIAKGDLRKWEAKEALAACREQWLALGMRENEARAIVEIWKSDLDGRVGVLVITPMPRPFYDRMFPIEIEPKPEELVRAGLVFDTLPGQSARRSWLPALAASLRATGADLAGEAFESRLAAQTKFLAAGDIGLGVLAELAQSEDPEVSQAALRLSARISKASDVGISALRPTKENSTSFVEHLNPPKDGRTR